MTPGLRLDVEIETPHDCPLGDISEQTGTNIEWMSKSTTTAGTSSIEFALPNDTTPGRDEFDEVFRGGNDTLYRTTCDADRDCPCRCIEGFGHPIADMRAQDGLVGLTFHVPDSEGAEQVVRELQSQFESVELRHVSWASKTPGEGDIALVDQGRFTDRQREVLQTAHEMGYFEYPKAANAQEVATQLDIDSSTFAEHLAAAQSKLMDAVVTSHDGY